MLRLVFAVLLISAFVTSAQLEVFHACNGDHIYGPGQVAEHQ